MIERYYHYCCTHSAHAITQRGFLRPGPALFDGVPLIWLTNQATPDREGLGLTSHLLPCDRLEYQYIVDVLPGDVEPWASSTIRLRQYARHGDTFTEFEAGRQPATWYIARRRLYAIRNRFYRPPT